MGILQQTGWGMASMRFCRKATLREVFPPIPLSSVISNDAGHSYWLTPCIHKEPSLARYPVFRTVGPVDAKLMPIQAALRPGLSHLYFQLGKVIGVDRSPEGHIAAVEFLGFQPKEARVPRTTQSRQL